MKRKELKKLRVQQKAAEAVHAYRNTDMTADPLGQYTGLPEEVQQAVPQGKIYINPQSLERPTQDADDL